MMKNNNQIVIIGGGMAGLTAAAYLTKENYNVLLLEKNSKCGGLVGTFSQNDFYFDSGPRAFVNSGMVKPMLNDLDINFESIDNTISIGVENEIIKVESMASLQDYKELLLKLYPSDSEDINNIIEKIEELSEYTRILYEFDNPNFVNLKNNYKYIFKKLIPWTFKFLHALRKMNQHETAMETYLKKFTNNQSLLDILTQFFFKKTPSHFALGYFYVYLDYFYPKGGTGTLVNLLYDKIVESGGKIELNKKIIKIDPKKSIVRDSNLNEYHYDHLIWAADLKTFYEQVNTSELNKEIKIKFDIEKNSVLSSKCAESVFILFLGVDRPPTYFRERGGEHFFYTPSKKGLGETHLSELDKLIKNFESVSKNDVKKWFEKFIELNTFEISIPALRDSSLAPSDQTGIMISFLSDYQIFDKISEAGWENEIKEVIENKVIELLSNSVYKDLDQDVIFKFSSNPISIKKYAGNSGGAITGWSFETPSPVYHQLKDLPKSALTAIPNIYKAGQWAYAPSGVPIAMLTGWYATRSIIE